MSQPYIYIGAGITILSYRWGWCHNLVIPGTPWVIRPKLFCDLINSDHNYDYQNCLPSYWKSQENGRERFCRLFVPGAAVTTVLGFLQPVSDHDEKADADADDVDDDNDDDDDGHDGNGCEPFCRLFVSGSAVITGL